MYIILHPTSNFGQHVALWLSRRLAAMQYLCVLVSFVDIKIDKNVQWSEYLWLCAVLKSTTGSAQLRLRCAMPFSCVQALNYLQEEKNMIGGDL